MTMQFKPSKWGHILDDANMTMLVQPIPGTQTIYEYINDCSAGTFTKMYPPNSTVIVYNQCPIDVRLLGEVTKFVVQYNCSNSNLWLGDYNGVAFTREVVIKQNDGYMFLTNRMNSIDIQNNNSLIAVYGDVLEHIDIKNNSKDSTYYLNSNLCPDLWVDSQCGKLLLRNPACGAEWEDYINTSNC